MDRNKLSFYNLYRAEDTTNKIKNKSLKKEFKVIEIRLISPL